MKNIKLLLVLFAAVALQSCGTSAKSVWREDFASFRDSLSTESKVYKSHSIDDEWSIKNGRFSSLNCINEGSVCLDGTKDNELVKRGFENGIGELNFDYRQVVIDSCFIDIFINDTMVRRIKTMGEPQKGSMVEIRKTPINQSQVNSLKFVVTGGDVEIGNIYWTAYNPESTYSQKYYIVGNEKFENIAEGAESLKSENGVNWNFQNVTPSNKGITLGENGKATSSSIKGGVGYLRFDIYRESDKPIIFDVKANGELVQRFDMTTLEVAQQHFTSGALEVLVNDDVVISFESEGAPFTIGNVVWGNLNDMLSDYVYTKNNPAKPFVYVPNKSVEQMWDDSPEIVKSLLDSMNLNYAGLEQVKKHYKANDYVKASYALLDYYKEKSKSTRYYLAKPAKVTDKCVEKYDRYCNFDMNYYRHDWWQYPQRPDGVRDYRPLWPDYPSDWRRPFINRQDFLQGVIDVWQKTGNGKYAQFIDHFITDWINAFPTSPAQENFPHNNLDNAIRMRDRWTKVFFMMLDADEFSPATRLLMLHSIIEQCNALRYDTTFSRYTNIYLHRQNALVTIGANFPEFKSSKAWAEYGLGNLSEVLQGGLMYPDGLSSEMATAYNTNQIFDIAELFEEIELGGFEYPNGLDKDIEQQWNAQIYATSPTGELAHFGDSPRRELSFYFFKNDSIIYRMFDRRADWLYIVSNGEKGVKPEGEPSQFYPYSGLVISRNGWDKKAHWGMFDIGVRGTSGHAHLDKLHISLAANGHFFLIDSGKPLYENAVGDDVNWREYYFKGSAGHNVILIDNQIQNEPESLNTTLLDDQYYSDDKCTFAIGNTDQFANLGDVNHSRSFVYVKDKYWVVIDSMKLDKERQLDALWHFDVGCKVDVEDKTVVLNQQDEAYLKIVPIGNEDWNLRIAEGEEKPNIQGWENPTGHDRKGHPIKTAVYTTKSESTIFGWILLPYTSGGNVKGEIVEITETAAKVKVEYNGSTDIVTVPLVHKQKPTIE